MSATRVKHVENGLNPAVRGLVDNGRVVIINGDIMDGVYDQHESKIGDIKDHR